MPRALLGEIGSGLREPNRSALTPFDPVQHLIEAGTLRKAPELTRQILLERLATSLGATLERGVDFVGDVADEDIHACRTLARRGRG
jgi:hypothetical protein